MTPSPHVSLEGGVDNLSEDTGHFVRGSQMVTHKHLIFNELRLGMPVAWYHPQTGGQAKMTKDSSLRLFKRPPQPGMRRLGEGRRHDPTISLRRGRCGGRVLSFEQSKRRDSAATRRRTAIGERSC